MTLSCSSAWFSHRIICCRSFFAFVFYAAQVEDAVYDDAVQLVFEALSVFLGVAFDGVEADEYVAAYPVAFGVVEGDDVGVVVVLQVLPVDFQDAAVVAKDVADLSGSFSVRGGYGFDPPGYFSLFMAGT